MFNSTKFFIFANQGTPLTVFQGGTAVNLYRDFINDPQLNGPVSEYRIGPDLSFIRNSYATYFNSVCAIETVGNNIPRFGYTPTGQSLGLLIEKPTTNHIPYSTDFTQAVWSKPLTANSGNFGVTLETNVPGISAPDNTETATRVTNTSAYGYHVLSWGELPVPPNQELELSRYYTRSVFVKKDTARYLCVSVSPAPSAESITTIFDFNVPGFITESTLATLVTPIKDDWYKLEFTRLTTNSQTNRFTIGIASGPDWTNSTFETAQDNLSSFYIWGAQAEFGVYSTSYIPSSGAETSRAGDNVSIVNRPFTTIYNLSAGSFYLHTTKNNFASYGGLVTVIDNLSAPEWPPENTQEYRELLKINNTPLNTFVTFTNNISSKFWTLGSIISPNIHSLTNTSAPSAINIDSSTGSNFGVAVGLFENDFIIYQNGLEGDNLDTGTLPQKPIRPVQFQLGRFKNEKYLDGYVQRFGYWPTRLSNNELSALSIYE